MRPCCTEGRCQPVQAETQRGHVAGLCKFDDLPGKGLSLASVEEPLLQPGKIIGKVGACSVRGIRDRMCFERPAVLARHQQFQIGLANVENCDPRRGYRWRHRCLPLRFAAQMRNCGDGNQDATPDRQREELAEIEKVECRRDHLQDDQREQ